MSPDIQPTQNLTHEEERRTLAGTAVLAGRLVLSATLLTSLAVIKQQSPAEAAFSNDYPHSNAAAYNAANYEWWIDENGDGQPYVTSSENDNDESVSSRGYAYRNCTDGAAYWTSKFIGISVSGWGHASTWDSSASAYTVRGGNSKDVEPGDIAQSDDGLFGHVGMVIGVSKNSNGDATSVKVAELNKLGTGNYSETTYTTKNSSGNFVRAGSYDWDHFIDLNGNGKGLENETIEGGNSAAATLSRPAVITHNGALNVFIRGGDGQIYNQYWNGTSWTGFSSIGGNMASDPAVITIGAALNVFARGADNQIYHKYNNGSGWSGWASTGSSTMRGNPKVVAHGSEVDLFALGTDNQPYKKTWNGTGWGGWSSLGNYMDSSPAALSFNSELDVVMRGGDNQIYKDTWNGSSWSGFNTLGNPGSGGAAGNPDIMQFGNRFDIWTNTAQNHVYKRTWTGSSWTNWADMGSGFAGDVDAMQYNSDINVFVRGSDGHIYTRYYSANSQSWSSWTSLGGSIAGEPTAVQYGSELSVFATGTDSKVYKNTFFPSSGWGGFSAMPG